MTHAHQNGLFLNFHACTVRLCGFTPPLALLGDAPDSGTARQPLLTRYSDLNEVVMQIMISRYACAGAVSCPPHLEFVCELSQRMFCKVSSSAVGDVVPCIRM